MHSSRSIGVEKSFFFGGAAECTVQGLQLVESVFVGSVALMHRSRSIAAVKSVFVGGAA